MRFCTGSASTRAHTAATHLLGTNGICLQPGNSSVEGICNPRTDLDAAHVRGIWPHMRQVTDDQVVLRSMTGHATEEMTEHYSHIGLREKHAAVAVLVRLVPTFRSDQRDRSGDSGGDAPLSTTGGAL